MQIRYPYLLLDADGTLLDFLACEKDALKKCLQKRGLPTDDHTVSVYSAINQKWWEKLERKETTRPSVLVERFRELFEYLGYDGDCDAMRDDYTLELAKNAFLMDGALDVCRELSKTYRLYIITNGNAYSQHERLDRSPLRPCLERLFISEEIGADKPAKAFFDVVEKEIKAVDPTFDKAHALVVGDSLSSDILGGVNAGIDTCWLSFGKSSEGKPIQPTYTIFDIRELPLFLERMNGHAPA